LKRAYHFFGVSRICGLVATQNIGLLRSKSEYRYQGLKLCAAECAVFTEAYAFDVDKADHDLQMELNKTAI
jgi:hypothetical protein